MDVVAAPPPIPGKVIDPPPKQTPEVVQKLDDRDDATGTAVGVGYRAKQRYAYAQAGLLAAGTTYYLFLALFAIVAFAYGLVAIFNADSLAQHLTDSLSDAFPGLVGHNGIDPGKLQTAGRSASIIGLIALLWAGGGAMVAASGSFHQIFGAAPDPRNFLKARLRLLGWMVLLLPLVAASYAASAIVVHYADDVLDAINFDASFGKPLLATLSILVSLLFNFWVVYLLLGHFGGIRPQRHARVIGATFGAIVIGILNYLMAWIISLSTKKPEYGALAAPIAILLVLYLQCMAAYWSAALAAGVAERDIPLEQLNHA